ncbi:16S rRNA (uracil(1498)-N(3))-methyltransferase [Proteiniphilum sp. UBA1028]|uniref:16S rRNA (uracil(1498)-N(3))-methyltransferase n=1 Tax=Proteiniphilum sp. UBA1028 TaxID=1947251 RepID=UPI000E8A1078|nr:16S rRNA (uracil(1498)-N(3))-methyltransferase [Proteiniphilum sp. UBA1028]HBG56482.1 16S rRNA (uracil(1498)-N(3))-methyltransferase [Porphyromonadaceae bacterium]
MPDTLFYCPDISRHPQLPIQESQHCVKVLRMREGDKLTVTDGQGFFYECLLAEAHPKHCSVHIQHRISIARNRDFLLQVAFAPTKQMERNEWFVEKAVEIGIDRFIPLLSNYSERRDLKKERLEKIAVSAMKQSQQAFLPGIEEMVQFVKFVTRPFEGRKFIAHCYNLPKKPLAQTYRKGENALILIGPEGDFSEEEIHSAIANGFEPVSLGETRLRTETACLVATHTIHIINNQI